jgi:hypothetical protein
MPLPASDSSPVRVLLPPARVVQVALEPSYEPAPLNGREATGSGWSSRPYGGAVASAERASQVKSRENHSIATAAFSAYAPVREDATERLPASLTGLNVPASRSRLTQMVFSYKR